MAEGEIVDGRLGAADELADQTVAVTEVREGAGPVESPNKNGSR